MFEDVPRVQIADASFQFPSAVAIVELAVAKALRGELVAESAIEITYLRAPYVHPKQPGRAEGAAR